jgi:hypothetical protein
VIAKIFAAIPHEVTSKFYGCGAPLPLGVCGRRFLDLGSGSGRDCYARAALWGAGQRVRAAAARVLTLSRRRRRRRRFY